MRVHPAWLIRRVRVMTLREVAGRVVLLARQAARFARLRRDPFKANAGLCREVRDRLLSRSDSLSGMVPAEPVERRMSVFGTGIDVDDPVPLVTASYDVRGLRGFGPWINWRSDRWGDIREFWERCRLQWLAGAVDQADDPGECLRTHLRRFLQDHPPLDGPAWTSGLEGAVRAVSVSLALGAVPSQSVADARAEEAANDCLDACRDLIMTTRSVGSSANNHALGELSAMALLAVIGGGPGPAAAVAIRRASEEFLRQTYPDGSGREAANCYWRFNLEWAFLVSALAEVTRTRLPDVFEDRLARACSVLGEKGLGAFPRFVFGDSDDARVWTQLLRPSGPAAPQDLRSPGTPVALEAGLAIGRYPAGAGNTFSVALRAGPFGFPATMAHSHADQLAVFVAWNAVPVFVDPGCDRYFGETVRDQLRETRSHATFRVGGSSQGRRAGRFLWADVRPGEPAAVQGGCLRGTWKDGPVHLSRQVRPNPEGGLEIEDRVEGSGDRMVEWSWPLGPGLSIDPEGRGQWRIEGGPVAMRFTVSAAPAAWDVVPATVSESYGVRSDAKRLELTYAGDCVLQWRLVIERDTAAV